MRSTGTQPTKISDHVECARSRLEQAFLCFGHGCDNARDEAIWATLHVAGLIEHEYHDVLDRELSEKQIQMLRELLDMRIATRKPLAYLIGQAWFAGLDFHIDERAIVPRSHFGDLIQDGFVPWVLNDATDRVLDLCTGSGCIAIAMAMHYPAVTLDAADIDAEALDVARMNIDRFNVSQRVRLIESDLFDQIEFSQYDLIVCNPPYVSISDTDALPAEYQHEPRLALEADEDGLGVVRRILGQAARYLSANGHLLMELGDSANELESRFPEVPFFWLTSRSGDSVVMLLSAEQLKSHASSFGRA